TFSRVSAVNRGTIGSGLRLPSAHLPGRAVFARRQLPGFGIADDLLFLGVPADLLSGKHGDQAKVTGNGRVMPDFNGRNGRLARSYAVKKVLLVIGGGVELHFAQLPGQVFA